MARKVVEYDLAWNPTENEGKFILRFDDGGEKKAKVTTAAEFAAIAAILKEKEVFFFDTGYLGTNPRD